MVTDLPISTPTISSSPIGLIPNPGPIQPLNPQPTTSLTVSVTQSQFDQTPVRLRLLLAQLPLRQRDPMAAASTSRSVLNTLGWIPVALFFNEHVYSFATVKGRSMQVSQTQPYSK